MEVVEPEIESSCKTARFGRFQGTSLERVVTESTATAGGVTEDLDIVPGRYEGGMKIWECCRTLVDFVIARRDSWKGLKVLEIGCGHGLPGISALRQGASVDFCDFNGDVLRAVTMPNVAKNCGGVRGSRFFCGDWRAVSDLMVSRGIEYDVIIGSDVVYCPESIPSLVEIISKVLKKPSGAAFIAGRRFYFGVGGGTKELCQIAGSSVPPLTCTREQHFTTGVEREIVGLRWNQPS